MGWCYFGENAGKGMGPPQNVIDKKCAYHTCCCEQDFISKMIELLWNGYLFDYSYHHSVWSTRWNTCSYSGGPHTLDCCGEYPNRRPYFTDTHLDCCNNRVLYNFNHKMCCKDGMVRDQC